MSDETWTAYREAQKQRRAERVPVRTQALIRLRAAGYEVEQKTPYHFRINGLMDVWPTHNRWHDLRTKQRGGAKDLAAFIKSRIHPDERK